jgi:galactokinase
VTRFLASWFRLRSGLPSQAPRFVRARKVGRHASGALTAAALARVLATCQALRGDDRETLGRVFAESHASLRDDFRVSTPQLDELVSALCDAGAFAARLTGAGFGGCVVDLVEDARMAEVSAAACASYRAATGLEPAPLLCRPSPRAGPA